MGSSRVPRLLKIAYLTSFILYFLWNLSPTWAEELDETTQRAQVKLSAILRNISQSANLQEPSEYSTTVAPRVRVAFRRRVKARIKSLQNESQSDNSSPLLQVNSEDSIPESNNKRESFQEIKSLHNPPTPKVSKISGVVKGNKRNPQDLIRSALINHTLAHGGEQDLDKLVFSNIPNGSKLVLRTVRIIRTDEDGNPLDDSEHAQPTYWDVTLANATDPHDGVEEGVESESDESDDEEEEIMSGKEAVYATGQDLVGNAEKNESTPSALKSMDGVGEDDKTAFSGVRRRGKKKPDLESSGSHSAANYHHLNDYGTMGREKERGTTNYHGNTHGNTHKQTYTVTDGKDVKPYHGTEKGLTDYTNDHGKSHKDQGERFKTHKRKNKGRKVTGFKRVYHKEEYQRTEHFFDDEEAKKIAESFGLSEAKDADNHGTKGDKRKYQGVRTEYLDGKKHENEHGTHDGYNKGQHTSYRDSEKHNHHSNYGKSQSHGSPPQYSHHGYDDDYQQNHHNNHNSHQQPEYHPNHNYHASYSNPKKSTISQVPKTLIDQLAGSGGGRSRSIASILSAPMAHSFTVTEFTPLPLIAESISTSQNPRQTTVMHAFGASGYDNGNLTIPPANLYDNQTAYIDENTNKHSERRRPLRKRPRQKKTYFSPKHRPVQEEEVLPNTNPQKSYNYDPLPEVPPQIVPYQVSSVSDVLNSPLPGNSDNKHSSQIFGENETQYTPYAPNFGPPSLDAQYIVPPKEYRNRDPVGHHPKTWRWNEPRRPNRPYNRPAHYSPLQMQLLQHGASGYPRTRNRIHLADIPLRHASAFHRLGNRHYGYQTLKHHPKPQHHHELSTRRSDTDNDKGDNDSAHYFNHNQRYAKNHLTSTTDPLRGYIDDDNSNAGVRNTMIDPTPGVYSTVIKVLPATMLNVTDSNSQQTNLNQHHIYSKVSGLLSAATPRPSTQVDSISITTAYPQRVPLASQQQQFRPFLPKKRWLTFTFNLGNPNFKLASEYGPSQHPFQQNSQKSSNILQGIRNGLGFLKPMGRGSPGLLVSPTAISQQKYHERRPLQHLHNDPRVRMFKHPHHPIFAHNVVSYENFGEQSPKHFQSSMAESPSLVVGKSEKPKFYYDKKQNQEDIKDLINNEGKYRDEATESKGHNRESHSRHTPTLKVAQSLTPLPTTPSITLSPTVKNTSRIPTSTKTPEIRKSMSQPTQSPPFINGIMDSVADFFGKMG